MTGTDEPPPPPPEAGSGLTPASFAPDGDLRLDTASCEFDAEVAVQLEGALQAGEVVEQGQAAQARAQAGMEGEGSQSLYRAFTRSQPGAALDHLDHLGAALAGGARRALVTCSPVPSCDNSPSDHVLHGYGRRSRWVSTSSTRTSALLYALWLHAKAGPTPRAPAHVSAKLPQERARRLEAARAPACAWEADLSEYIIAIARDALPEGCVVSLETTSDRAAAKVRAWKAARRSEALHEVLISCPVTTDEVTAVYRIDFRAPYGSRMVRFKKDYFAMVAPKDLGMPAWDTMRARLFREFADEGARWVGGEVELPDVVWCEFAETAAASVA